MTKDYIGYQALADLAMRSIVREALRIVETKGMIGNHHLFISFKTHFPGVDIPDFLKEQYPDEITIVLQNQYWGLAAGDDAFEVTLKFRKVPATLHVPYAALTSFVDKGANFGLQFTSGEDDAKPGQIDHAPPPPQAETKPAGEQSAPLAFERKDHAEAAASLPSDAPGEVVSLDKFRKK